MNRAIRRRKKDTQPPHLISFDFIWFLLTLKWLRMTKIWFAREKQKDVTEAGYGKRNELFMEFNETLKKQHKQQRIPSLYCFYSHNQKDTHEEWIQSQSVLFSLVLFKRTWQTTMHIANEKKASKKKTRIEKRQQNLSHCKLHCQRAIWKPSQIENQRESSKKKKPYWTCVWVSVCSMHWKCNNIIWWYAKT